MSETPGAALQQPPGSPTRIPAPSRGGRWAGPGSVHPQGASQLPSCSGISAGSGRNVVAAGTMLHLALVTSVTAREQLSGTALLPRSRQEADGDDTSCHFLWQDVRAFSTTLPFLAQQGLGHHCSGLPKLCATHRHQHPAAPTAISILVWHMWDGHWAAVPAHQRRTQELNQKEPAAWDLLPLSPAHS